MQDHTYMGTPVSEMSTEHIHDCLTHGFVIHSSAWSYTLSTFDYIITQEALDEQPAEALV